jgi:hypothetical protein
MITADYVRKRLSYDCATGIFIWRVNHRRPDLIGKPAGCRQSTGYWAISVDNKKILAHRLAWFYVTGSWPAQHIDHIDGNKLNNSFDNLRDVSRFRNLQNITAPTKANKSGFLGVCKHQGKWLAQIMVNGQRYRKSGFDTPEAAHEHYQAMKQKMQHSYILPA